MIGPGRPCGLQDAITVGGSTQLNRLISSEVVEATLGIETLLPISDGSRIQFETFTGLSRYQSLNDDNDGTYVSSALSYKINSVKFSPIDSISKVIDSVEVFIRAHSNQSESISMTISNDGLNYFDIATGSLSVFEETSVTLELNPDFGLAWTSDSIIATSFGMRTGTLEADETITCSKMWLVVNYQ